MTRTGWPGGRAASRFYSQIQQHSAHLAAGWVLYVDPSSGSTSGVGWSLWFGGACVGGGEIRPPRTWSVSHRLASIQQSLGEVVGVDGVDVLVLECLRGRMVHPRLHWSVGAIVAGVKCDIVLEIPIPVWKAVARSDAAYAKGDAADARAFGEAVARLVRGLGPGDSLAKVDRRKFRGGGRVAGSGRVRRAKPKG